MHKQSKQGALTKAELRHLLVEREDLVRRVAAFGADIPTTPHVLETTWQRTGMDRTTDVLETLLVSSKRHSTHATCLGRF